MSQANTISYGYDPPNQVAPDLWEVRGRWSNKFGRRMTVIRLRSGALVIHSAIQLQPRELQWLASLGPVQYIVAPNIFHYSDAGWMKQQFPGARLFIPIKRAPHFEKLGLEFFDSAADLSKLNMPDLDCFPFQGTSLQEIVFLHKPSRTLILCDLAFNMASVFTGLEKWIMNWNKVGGRFGPSRLTRLLFTKDLNRVQASYARVLEWDFDRVIVNHGEILETGGKELLRSSAAEIFGTFAAIS